MRSPYSRIVLCALIAGCIADPVVPNAVVTTLDESGTHGFVAVSAGLEHTCALTADGSAYCWGSNEYGQLGAPSDTTCARDTLNLPCRSRPMQVTGGVKFQKISAGGRITCGLAHSGAIYCWGDNLHGGLGDPAFRASEAPIPIASTALFSDVAAGGEHACGLRTDGVALCWGANGSGQLGGSASGSSAATPILVATGLRFVSMNAASRRTCARQSDGATFCWGATWVSRTNGEEVLRSQATPLRMQSPEATHFTSIAPGTNTTCGTTSDNLGYCWEANPTGSIGDGTSVGSLTPKPVGGGLRLVAVSSGGLHTCGIADTGGAWCWGSDVVGQLGISSTLLSARCGASRQVCSTRPVPVSGYRRYSQVSAGQGDHSCGLTIGGNVFCWGSGRMGQRGNGATFNDWSPVRALAPASM